MKLGLISLLLAALSISTVACVAPAEAPAAKKKNHTPAANGDGDEKKNNTDENGSSGNASTKVDLGESDSGSELTFTVPANTLGFAIVVDAHVTDDDFVGVQELIDPNGNAVVTDFHDATSGGASTSSRALLGSSGDGVGVVRVPLIGDHATDPVTPGTWKVRTGGLSRGAPNAPKGSSTLWSGKTHAVVQFQVTSDGSFKGGALDLDLYIPDGLQARGDDAAATPHTVTADTAGNDPAIKARIDLGFEVFKRLYGVDRGAVRYHAIAGSVKEIKSQEEINDANELANTVNARPAAQLILTNRLSPDGDEGEISGVSNCMPGAIGVPGTRCSAVILSLRDSSPAWLDALVMVHELSHFVGIEHTTEFGGSGDSLSDTPECANTEKAALQSCADHANLMFPSANMVESDSESWVSDTQKALFQSSLLYRAN